MKCLFTGQIADIYASSPLLCQICAADGALPHAERHVAAPCAKGNGEGRNHTNLTISACDRITIYTADRLTQEYAKSAKAVDCDIIAPPTCFASGRRSFPHTRSAKG